ncbi:uncharacterized protein LOC116338061 [Contarinia nasturtii]|uniref:uncharacterized protein LOC116338061 n=1 Tax=Contarinia nasturtii TaxID=265458 RepID=UPI0012D411AB|nr:uncharacterized protein LOC116338061 [Contarinia nasturtii]
MSRKLFIWNDRKWRLINAEDEYDKVNFFIIKILFVRWKMTPVANDELNAVRIELNKKIGEAFAQFGKIEVVQTVCNCSPTDHDVYVTFERSEDAYKAFMHNRFKQKVSNDLDYVMPIDTWKISTRQTKLEEVNALSKRITDVDNENPQCIFRIDITGRFLLKFFRSLLRLCAFSIEGLDLAYKLAPGDEDYEESSSLEFFPVGEAIKEVERDEKDDEDTDDETDASECSVETVVPQNPEPDDYFDMEIETDIYGDEYDANMEDGYYCLEDYEFEKNIAEIVCNKVGPKFKTLTIRHEYITPCMLASFVPVLQMLHTFNIHTEYNGNLFFVLPAYCPQVRSFHLNGIDMDGDFNEAPVLKWPTLHELYLCTSDSDVKFLEKFRKFIELNDQLEALQVECDLDIPTIQTIGRTLKNLTTLALIRRTFEGLNGLLDSVVGLSELRGLKLSVLKVERHHLNALGKCAKRLCRMPNMQLNTIFLNCETETDEKEKFKNLEEFSISHHYNCKCHGTERIVIFQNKCVKVPFDSNVLVLIVNTKKPIKTADRKLEADIMAAFRKTTKFFPNTVEYLEMESKNNYIYIQVGSDKPE